MIALPLESTRLQMFYKMSVVKNFATFTGKHLCASLFFNQDAGLTIPTNYTPQKRKVFGSFEGV